MAPSEHETTDDGEIWTWRYADLIVDRDIRLTLPRRLSVAQRAAALQDKFRVLAAVAPLLVSTFVLALAGVLRLSSFRLPLTGYVLTGLGLALFYPLLTFLSGLVPLPIASAIALLLISSMVLAYLRSASAQLAVLRRALALLVTYLGFFSIGSLTPWRGLALSTGGLLLVGTFMVLWPRSTDQNDDPAELSHAVDAPEADPSPPQPAGPAPDPMCCPYCGRALSSEYQFCPGCGRGTGELHRCVVCGQVQLCPSELGVSYCLCCGAALH